MILLSSMLAWTSAHAAQLDPCPSGSLRKYLCPGGQLIVYCPEKGTGCCTLTELDKMCEKGSLMFHPTAADETWGLCETVDVGLFDVSSIDKGMGLVEVDDALWGVYVRTMCTEDRDDAWYCGAERPAPFGK